MREFNLGHVISAYSHHSGSLNSLWGLFVAGSFSAVGFGASVADEFALGTALAVTAAYLLFTAGHLYAILTFVKKMRVMSDEVPARLEANPADFTDYPRTAASFFAPVLSPSRSVMLHVGIDACVVAILWSGFLWPAAEGLV